MILLVVSALLFLPSNAQSANSQRAHLSDSLKVKCDALPYRTAFFSSKCYFAVSQEVKHSEASALCATIFTGSKIEIDVPGAVFSKMMLDRSKFHGGKDSSGKASKAKQSICTYESGYECASGEPSVVFPGKCLARSDNKKNFANALSYCQRLDMELPSVGNDAENRMIIAAVVKDPMWIHNVYSGEIDRKWHRLKHFGRYNTCDRPNPSSWGAWGLTSFVYKTGYWGIEGQSGMREFVCVKDAENDFTGRSPCKANHELNRETGVCEWTAGPRDACAQIIDVHNRSIFMSLYGFPQQTFREMGVWAYVVGDLATKVIVRKGCMFVGYQHPRFGEWYQEAQSTEHVLYGEHKVLCHYTGDVGTPGEGLSRAQCFCDPTEATLNDHIPAPPPDKKCIEHHEFNEVTQQCEWKHDPKFCGELITHDGRRQMLEISNWPSNRRYDVHHWNNATKRNENFHRTVTEIIVRQHCWATLYNNVYHGPQTLPTSGYGRHQVKSFYNGRVPAEDQGTHRVVCECIAGVGKPYVHRKPKEEKCKPLHKLDKETGRCEWDGPNNACAQIIDIHNRTWFFPMADFPKQTYIERGIWDLAVADVAITVIVRRGCMFFGYQHPRSGHGNQEDVSVRHSLYGEHHILAHILGDVQTQGEGLSRVNCFCDPTEATLNDHEPPPPKKKCVEHHKYNETTQTCEWIHDPKFCAELINHEGQRKMLEIPNWPQNRRYDVDRWSYEGIRNENFHRSASYSIRTRITEIIVRQHCWATLYYWQHHEHQTLPTAGYGRHQVKSYYNGLLGDVGQGTHRVVCECIR